MSSITMQPNYRVPATQVVRTAELEQIAEDVQTLHEMLMALEVALDDAAYGKFISVIRERSENIGRKMQTIICGGEE